MFPDTRSSVFRDLIRHAFGLVTPRLVSHFIHITIVAGQVTPAVDLNDELPKGGGAPAIRLECRDVESRWPFEPRWRPHTWIESQGSAYGRISSGCSFHLTYGRMLDDHLPVHQRFTEVTLRTSGTAHRGTLPLITNHQLRPADGRGGAVPPSGDPRCGQCLGGWPRLGWRLTSTSLSHPANRWPVSASVLIASIGPAATCPRSIPNLALNYSSRAYSTRVASRDLPGPHTVSQGTRTL